MHRLIALRGVPANKNVAHLQEMLSVIYKDRSRVVEFLLHLENKHITPNNAETEHKHMTLYS